MDITLAHEAGHRELIDTTSLGMYMKILAFASEMAKTPQARSDARGALVEAVEQCWSVQEGYATRRQIAYCYGKNRPDVTRHVWQNLPGSYVNAYKEFPIDEESLKRQIDLALGENSAKLDAFRGGLEYAAYVIARAAMSLPIAQILANATSLPSYEASLAIRRQSPDVRLKTLSAKVTPAFTWKCVMTVAQAVAKIGKNGTPRLLDEKLDELARELSQEAGLPYEPSYEVDITSLPRKLGCEQVVQFLDARDLPQKEFENYSYNMDVVGEDLSQVESMPVEEALNFYEYAFSKMAGLKPHVVCELGAREESDGTIAWLHVYATRDEAVNYLNHTGAHEKARIVGGNHQNSAQLLLLLPLAIRATAVPKLVEWFSHRTWAWVVGDVLLRNHNWSLVDLQKTGEVFAVPLSVVASFDRKIKSVYMLPQSAEADEATRAWLGHLEKVPESVVLLVFHDDAELPGARMVRLAAIDYMKNRDLNVASFNNACTAETLLMGYYATHILSSRLKGAANE
jgi:hypothetical protein